MTTKNELFNLLQQKENADSKMQAARAKYRAFTEDLFAELDDEKFTILEAQETAAYEKFKAAEKEFEELRQAVSTARKAVGRTNWNEWQAEFYKDYEIEDLTHLRLVPAQDVNAEYNFKPFKKTYIK